MFSPLARSRVVVKPTEIAGGSVTRSRRRSRGQSVVEFALVLLPMLLLLLGAIQFAIIWAAQVGVTNAVRDAARVASLQQPKADAAGNVTADPSTGSEPPSPTRSTICA